MQHPQLPPDTLLSGRYAIAKSLSSGGFGQTYLANDRQLPGQPSCVVKQLKPQQSDPHTLLVARRLFETEVEVLYKLGSHDQIPRLFAHFEDQEEFFLVQEFIEGHSLQDELMAGQPMSEPAVVQLVSELLEVLTFVHQANVIHRDLKPANILRRDRDQKLVLIDFGAVKQISLNPPSAPGQTSLTVAIGTPGYMPNEQSSGKPRFSSDIYAIGMIGIQALTGLSPYALPEDPVTGEWIWHHRASASPQLKAVLDRMVKYDFRQRYGTAAEALVAMKSLYEPVADTIVYPSGAIDAALNSAGTAPTVAVPVAPNDAQTGSVTPLRPVQPRKAGMGIGVKTLSVLGGMGAVLAVGWGLFQFSPPSSSRKIEIGASYESTPAVKADPAQSPSPTPPLSKSSSQVAAPVSPVSKASNNPTQSSPWQLLGAASTGESLYLDPSSVTKAGQFTYRIGNDTLNAQADCKQQRWYVEGYGWYPPNSEATQKMLAIVCGT